MATLLRIVPKFAAVGATVPVALYLVSLAVPLFPAWLLIISLALCPPYILFLSTAACDPFDACSLNTLFWVAMFNALIYAILGCCICVVASYIKRRSGRLDKRGSA